MGEFGKWQTTRDNLPKRRSPFVHHVSTFDLQIERLNVFASWLFLQDETDDW